MWTRAGLWSVVFTIAVMAMASPRLAGQDPGSVGSPPKWPDLSGLTPKQAEAALAKYTAARQAWDQTETEREIREMPEDRAAIRVAVQRAEAQKKAMAARRAKGLSVWGVNPDKDYDWEADARADGISAQAIDMLRRDGLVITGPVFRQSFSVYSSGVVPFVTSDSMLNGFHVLLEASLRKYELRRAQRLRTVLEGTWSHRSSTIAGGCRPKRRPERMMIRRWRYSLPPSCRIRCF